MEYPNPYRSRPKHSGRPNNKKGHSGGTFTEKSAAWPGTPGKSGPDRSDGTYKARIYPKSEGI